jgi:hypothetical protein
LADIGLDLIGTGGEDGRSQKQQEQKRDDTFYQHFFTSFNVIILVTLSDMPVKI